MVEQVGAGWWLRREVRPPPLRLLLVGWRPGMRWQARDQSEARDPFLRLYWNRRGGAAIAWAGGRVALGPDRLVAIMPETPHRRRSTALTDHFFIHAACDEPGWRLAPGVLALPAPGWLRRGLARIAVADPPAPRVGQVALAIAAWALGELPPDDAGPDPERQRLADALLPFVRHPGSWPGSAALAARLGWPERTLNRRFHQLAGQSPRAWIGARRLDAACDLLAHGDEPIAAIAERLGYVDRFHFTRAFAAARGLGPASYRRLRR